MRWRPHFGELTSERRELVKIGALTLAVAGIMAGIWLVRGGFDLSEVLRVGRYAPSRSFVEQTVPDPVLSEDYGHDGQQFYVLASVLPDLPAAEGHVDDLQYRSRRILYPLVLSPFGEGPPMIWAMLAVNLLAVGAAGAGVGRLAQRCGLSPYSGLAVAVTPAMLESTVGGLADAVAFAFAVWGVVLWRRQVWGAAVLLALAALARETTLVVAAACLVTAPRGRRLPALIPLGAVAAWSAVVAVWLPPTGQANVVARFIVMPFEAWAEVGFTSLSVVLATALMFASVLAAVELRRDLPALAMWLVLDAALFVVVNITILDRPLNAARVAPLAVPAAALAYAHYHRRMAAGAAAPAARAGPDDDFEAEGPVRTAT